MFKQHILFTLIFFSSWANADPIYFVVSEIAIPSKYYDSYLLPLEQNSDIAHARNLIENGISVGEAIVVANIAAGSDGTNQDVITPSNGLWS